MSGPKNINHNDNENSRGFYKPEDSRINFAVPCSNVIEKIEICSVDLPKKLKTGIIEPVMTVLSENIKDKRFMLCADAKNVTCGVDKAGGDVDMFGFEDGETLELRKLRLGDELKVFNNVSAQITDDISEMNCELMVKSMQNCCLIHGERIREARENVSRQEYGLKKFISLGGEKWRESKYVYAISALHASLHQLKDYMRNALENVHDICKFIGVLNRSISLVPNGNLADYSHQKNMVRINQDYTPSAAESHFVRQRTTLWFDIRSNAAVTGSTIHDAIGLRGMELQKKFLVKNSSSAESEIPEIPEEDKKRMEYGTVNEKNAIATLVSVVIPVYYPKCYYIEEGCYKADGLTRECILVVSPDGSIREAAIVNCDDVPTEFGEPFAAIEVKCPFPKDAKITQHYRLPHYYVCQCLAEMFVLKTKMLLYLSWSADSTTVLEVRYDENLWNLIWAFLLETYDKETPKRPKDAGKKIKDIKCKISDFVKSNVKFIAEVPSFYATDTGLSYTLKDSPYSLSWPPVNEYETKSDSDLLEDIKSAMKKGSDVVEIAYNLQRRKATEVMVCVLTQINRDSSVELPCSVPIAFGLKDYKLTSAAMRKATEYVIEKCFEYGLQVCTLSADGQWIQLMTRDRAGKPLTVLQHQKDVWTKVTKLSKLELAKQFAKINVVQGTKEEILSKFQCTKQRSGELEILSKDTAFKTVKTPDKNTLVKLLSATAKNRKKCSKEKATPDPNEPSKDIINKDWIPEQLLSVIQDTDDESVREVVQVIDNQINLEYSVSDLDLVEEHVRYNTGENHADLLNELIDNAEKTLEEEQSSQAQRVDKEIIYYEKDDAYLNEINTLNRCEGYNEEDVMTIESRKLNFLQIAGNYSDEHYDIIEPAYSFLDVNDSQSSNDNLLSINDTFSFQAIQRLLHLLQRDSLASKRWQCTSNEDFKNILMSVNDLTSLTHKELDIITDEVLNLLQSSQTVRKSWKKKQKAEYLYNLIHFGEQRTQRSTRKKTPPKLSALCQRVLRSRSIPKAVLNIAYAEYIYEDEYEKWVKTNDFNGQLRGESDEKSIGYWYSYPEKYAVSKTFIGKSIDCSHNFTHLRVRCCSTGIGDVSPEAWKTVAKSNSTKLNISMVEDLIDKQSVPNARTTFSMEVEECMQSHGFHDAAILTNIIRWWYEANDTPAIRAEDRVKHLLKMRNFLLKNVTFSKFPPPGCYINSIPVVTFEGLLIDIDTKIQLHHLIGPYNIRSVGSLAAETTVGILQQLNPNSSVSIKARDVPALMSSAVDVMTCKLNADRGFYMRTSRRSGVYPTHESNTVDDRDDKTEPMSTSIRCTNAIVIRNHAFDEPERAKARRKIKFGSVSNPSAPSRGALPVRQYHRKDESKILPTKRLGIDYQ